VYTNTRFMVDGTMMVCFVSAIILICVKRC